MAKKFKARLLYGTYSKYTLSFCYVIHNSVFSFGNHNVHLWLFPMKIKILSQ